MGIKREPKPKKFIIRWDGGYGTQYDIIEAENQDSAFQEAHDRWKAEVELCADYCAIPYTKERAIKYGIEDE